MILIWKQKVGRSQWNHIIIAVWTVGLCNVGSLLPQTNDKTGMLLVGETWVVGVSLIEVNANTLRISFFRHTPSCFSGSSCFFSVLRVRSSLSPLFFVFPIMLNNEPSTTRFFGFCSSADVFDQNPVIYLDLYTVHVIQVWLLVAEQQAGGWEPVKPGVVPQPKRRKTSAVG